MITIDSSHPDATEPNIVLQALVHKNKNIPKKYLAKGDICDVRFLILFDICTKMNFNYPSKINLIEVILENGMEPK